MKKIVDRCFAYYYPLAAPGLFYIKISAKILVFDLAGFVEVVEPGELKEAVATQAREILEQLVL